MIPTKLHLVLSARLSSRRAWPCDKTPVRGPQRKLVLAVLAMHEGEPISHRAVAEITGLSYVWANRAIHTLVDDGLVLPTRHPRNIFSYRLDVGKLRRLQADVILTYKPAKEKVA